MQYDRLNGEGTDLPATQETTTMTYITDDGSWHERDTQGRDCDGYSKHDTYPCQHGYPDHDTCPTCGSGQAWIDSMAPEDRADLLIEIQNSDEAHTLYLDFQTDDDIRDEGYDPTIVRSDAQRYRMEV